MGPRGRAVAGTFGAVLILIVASGLGTPFMWWLCAFMWACAGEGWYLYVRTRKDLYPESTIHDIQQTLRFTAYRTVMSTALAILVIWHVLDEWPDLPMLVGAIGVSILAGYYWCLYLYRRRREQT